MTDPQKVAVVTGASSGIGASICRELAQRGYALCLSARRAERLATLKSELSNQTEILTVPADIRIESDCLRIFERLDKTWGRLDLLVNSAGLGREAPLMSGGTEAWREMLEVNVIGLSVATREAVARMNQQRSAGLIIHISSMSGHRVPEGTGGMYSATKHAVRALTEGLRRELRRAKSRIRVAAISPGFVETEFAEVMTGSKSRAKEIYSQFVCLQPEDIAQSVGWLLDTPPHMQVHDILIRPTEQIS